MEENKIYCSNCGELIENDDFDTVNGEIVCTDCIERHTTTCDRCGNTVWMTRTYQQTFVTGKGQTYIISRLKKEYAEVK